MMKAITLWEPWASLVALREKKIETRSWPTKYRGPIAIHAAKKAPGDIIFQEPFYSALKAQHDGDGIWFRGPCILAICNLVDCIEITPKFIDSLSEQELAFGDYTIGRFAWELKDVHQLKEPIKAKGRQRLWNWDETPHLVSIDPYCIGDTKIWTPRGGCKREKIGRA